MDAITILFDGNCRFCTKTAHQLARFGRPGTLVLRSFQEHGVLDAFPSITYDAAMKRMHAVMPDGTVHAGADAVARVLATRGWLRPLAALYGVPGLRQLADASYDWVARNRYRFMGKTEAPCEDGTCHLHH